MTTETLEGCYASVSRLIGGDAEPFAVIQRAEQHRAYWRPEKTKVILLAESHVYTTQSELQRSLRPLKVLPSDLPRGFVRLVYCLGYGENAALDSPIDEPRNSGTPQYWKLFYGCLNRVSRHADCASIQASQTPHTETRLHNKLRLLNQLKAAGIWLVDASVAALYRPGRPKPAPETRVRILQNSWDSYIGNVVKEAAPEAIVCIGLEVGRILHARLHRLGIPAIAVAQPNARGFDQLSILSACFEVCANPGAGRWPLSN